MKIYEYQIGFSKLTKKLEQENPVAYQELIIVVRLSELQQRAAYMVKQNKPTTSGTKITFRPLESAEQFQEELQKIIADGVKIGMTFEWRKEEKEHGGQTDNPEENE